MAIMAAKSSRLNVAPSVILLCVAVTVLTGPAGDVVAQSTALNGSGPTSSVLPTPVPSGSIPQGSTHEQDDDEGGGDFEDDDDDDDVCGVQDNQGMDYDECVLNVRRHECEFLAPLYLFIGRFNPPHTNTTQDIGDVSCSDASDAQILCSVLIGNSNNICTPVTDLEQALSNLCLEVWHVQVLLAPLQAWRSSLMFGWMDRLASLYCNQSLEAGGCLNNNMSMGSEQSCFFPFMPGNGSLHNSDNFAILQIDSIENFLNGGKGYAPSNSSALSLRLKRSFPTLYDTNATNTTEVLVEQIRYVLAYDILGHGDNTYEALEHYLETGSACSEHCETERMYSSQHLLSFLVNWARVAFVAQTILPLVVLAAGIRTGFKPMWEYPNRLMIYLAMAVFLYGAYQLPPFLEVFGVRNIRCNADDSLASSDDLKKNSLASYSCALNQFGAVVFRLVTLFVSVAWWQLAVKLQLWTKNRWFVVQVNGVVEAVFLLAAFVVSVTIAGIANAGEYSSRAVIHVCNSTNGTGKARLGLEGAAAIISLILIGDGCRRLVLVHRSSITLQKSQKSQKTSTAQNSDQQSLRRNGSLPRNGSNRQRTISERLPTRNRHQSTLTRSTRRRKRANRTMAELLRRIMFFILGILLAGTTAELVLIAAGTGIDASDAEFQFLQYAKCTRVLCGKLSPCDFLRPRLSPQFYSIHIVYYTLEIMCTVFMCAGIFSPMAWQKKLSVKEKDKQRRMLLARSWRRTQSAQSPECGMETLEVSHGHPDMSAVEGLDASQNGQHEPVHASTPPSRRSDPITSRLPAVTYSSSTPSVDDVTSAVVTEVSL